MTAKRAVLLARQLVGLGRHLTDVGRYVRIHVAHRPGESAEDDLLASLAEDVLA